MDTKRRVIGAFIVVIMVLSCTLASASARILDKSFEVGESSVTVTVTGTNDDDTPIYQLLPDSGEFEWEVSKTVLDPVTNTLVDEITAEVGDKVTFQINCVAKNIFYVCDNILIEGEDIFPKNFEFVDGYATSNFSEDTLYVNLTLLLEIEGCSNGINEVTFRIYCINESTGDEILFDEISDTARVRGVECPVPAFTTTGLIALASLLSAIAAVTIVRKRR